MDKTNCTWVKRNLTAYNDNQLEAVDQAAIREHLSQCPNCHKFWEEQQGLNEILDHLVLTAPPPELTGSILLAIKPLAEARRAAAVREFSWWDFILRGFALLVSTTLMALLSWVVYLGQRYGWSAPPRVMWLTAAGWWEKLRLLDHWLTGLAATLYHIWSSAVNWPANSESSFWGHSFSLGQLMSSHHTVLTIILVGLLIWVVVALVTTYWGSRILFNHGEERI